MEELTSTQKEAYKIKREALAEILVYLEPHWDLATALKALIESPFVTPNLLDVTWETITNAMQETDNKEVAQKLKDLQQLLQEIKEKELQEKKQDEQEAQNLFL